MRSCARERCGGGEACSSAVPTEKLDMFPKDYTVPSAWLACASFSRRLRMMFCWIAIGIRGVFITAENKT